MTVLQRRAGRLWLQGLDTRQIGRRLGLPEHEVYSMHPAQCAIEIQAEDALLKARQMAGR